MGVLRVELGPGSPQSIPCTEGCQQQWRCFCDISTPSGGIGSSKPVEIIIPCKTQISRYINGMQLSLTHICVFIILHFNVPPSIASSFLHIYYPHEHISKK